MPAEPVQVAVYLTELLDANSSHHVVSAAIYSIKWAHGLNGLSDPTNNAFVRNLHEAAKRITGHRAVKKDVVTSDIVKELCDKFKDSGDVAVIRDLCMITTSFTGFLRYDELSSIRCTDITMHQDFFKIEIQKSKTDQYRSGNQVVIAKGNTSACPHNMLNRYMSSACINTETVGYLFKPIFRSGRVCKLIYKDKKLSYTRARECILNGFSGTRFKFGFTFP